MSNYYIARWRGPTGCRTVLVKTGGTKHLQLVVMDYPITIMSVPLTEERRLTQLDYPLKRAVKKMRGYGRTHGITKGARSLLAEAQA